MATESTAPLIVLMALVQRADSTPDDAGRRSRPRYNVNAAGQGIDDAGAGDRTLALTHQPQFEWEAFDEYWRKVHGPKILHGEGPGGKDTITPLLEYYLQQHRVPGGPTSTYAPPYPALTGTDGSLVPDPSARVQPYRRPVFDGVAQLAYRSKHNVKTFFDVGPGKYGDKIVPDEAVFLRGFAFHLAEEHPIVNAGDRRRDPIILFKLHVRKADISRAQFMARWGGVHADLIKSLPSAGRVIRRCAQLRNVSTPDDGLYDAAGDRYDGSAAWSFSNMNDLEDFLAGAEHARVVADEQAFCAETSYFTALNYVIRDQT